MQDDEHLTFEVDTGLFRQLGELLVGRDSTAIIELVKNAYDADATLVILSGQNLSDPSRASLDILDNGSGMSRQQFRRGFLRLAARGKGLGARKSPIYERRYTGEKGVGRLAAHKLGGHLQVTSSAPVDEDGLALTPRLDDLLKDSDPRGKIAFLDAARHEAIVGSIDWDVIEQHETISAEAGGLMLPPPKGSTHLVRGTALEITRLRHTWTPADIEDLGQQLSNFEAPSVVVGPVDDRITAHPPLFGKARVRDASRSDPGLSIELEGDLRKPAERWSSLAAAAEWVLEIRAERGKQIRYYAYPTKQGQSTNAFSSPVSLTVPHPRPEHGPFFDARIYLRPGNASSIDRKWNEQNSGIRVYLEGFRVLPYGEIGNDWLALDSDYTRRSGRVDIDPLAGGLEDDLDALRDLKRRDVNLRLQPNRNFYGAVFLTDAESGGLRTLVNREGFVPDEAFVALTESIRTGLNILHRSWALAGFRLKQAASIPQKLADTEANEQPGDQSVESDENGNEEPSGADHEIGEDDVRENDGRFARGSAAAALSALAELRSLNPASLEPEADGSTLDAVLTNVESSVDRLIADASLLRVLASVGAQLASVTHELGHLIPIATAAEAELAPRPGERWPSRVVGVRATVTELRRSIERQASYLSDVSSGDARRRRSRLALLERVQVALSALNSATMRANITIYADIDPGIRTPPMFRADLQSILSNIITNAIKATPDGGIIRISAEQTDAILDVRFENTGTPLDLHTAEQWFVPFASTSGNIDPTLGQGMGLGLTITRELVQEQGGRIEFTAPSPGYATCLRLILE